jgi:uncharacterized protein
MDFEWNEKKSLLNLQKHGVSFHEGANVFSDPLAITFNDPDHSIGESRFLTFGHSRMNRLLIVSHVERQGRIRIINARKATKLERTIYENG